MRISTLGYLASSMTCRVELAACDAVMAKQSADSLGREVAGRPGIDDERPLACWAEHQRSADAGRSPTTIAQSHVVFLLDQHPRLRRI